MKKLMNFAVKHKVGLLMLVAVAVSAVLGSPLGLAGFAFAGVTTTDLTGGQKGIPASAIGKVTRIRKRITIAEAKQVASDIVNLLNIKAGWLVKQVHIIMVTPSAGTTLTASIGVADTTVTGYDVDGFDNAMSLKGAAGTRTYGIDGTDAYVTAGGFYAPEDTTIDATFVTVTSASGDVVIDVVAEIVDFND